MPVKACTRNLVNAFFNQASTGHQFASDGCKNLMPHTPYPCIHICSIKNDCKKHVCLLYKNTVVIPTPVEYYYYFFNQVYVRVQILMYGSICRLTL